jgi:Fic family protein
MTNDQTFSAASLLEQLREERATGVLGGAYHRLQVEAAYHSNRIEGSELSYAQVRSIFEGRTVAQEGAPVRVDDVLEVVNHFRCVDLCIDRAAEPLSEELVKDLHRTLKTATSNADRSWAAAGTYKQAANVVGGRATARPDAVAWRMGMLVSAYNAAGKHALDDILELHVRFERIHPFQDGNGRVGRLLMLKECLAGGITPFVIPDEAKLAYYRGLSAWDDDREPLRAVCCAAQATFAAWCGRV